ncbi:MAG: hypothetical protein ACLFP4_02875 [Spirochaetales bacterium]
MKGRNLENRLGVFVVVALFFGIGTTAFAADVIFHEPFDDLDSDTFEVWGTAEPFNRVEVFEGSLELEGSNGFEAFGAYFTPEFDLANGPLTIEVEITRRSAIQGSEINIWYVNQYLVDGDPWMEGDFVRVGLFSEREGSQNALLVQQHSPDARGQGEVLAVKGNAFEMGEPFTVRIELSASEYAVSIDGEQMLSGAHDLPATGGYLFIHDWNSVDSIDEIHDVKVRQ